MKRRDFVTAGLAVNAGIMADVKCASGTESPKYRKYEEMTAPEFTAAMEQHGLVFFPVGSLEFHGPHLPLGMDSIHAYEFCTRVAGITGGVVLPQTWWGTQGHEDWPGSLLISEKTFRSLVEDIFRLLAEQKAKLIVASTGHWPSRQGAMLSQMAEEGMKANQSAKILVLDPYTVNPKDPEPDHGGKKETSLMLAMRPELVHMDQLSVGEDPLKGIGKDCAEGTREFGEEYLSASVKCCADAVLEAKQGL